MAKKFLSIRSVHLYRTIEKWDKNKSQRLNSFRCKSKGITNSMSIWMNVKEVISFPSPQLPSLLGYNAWLDENGEYHLGYKMIPPLRCILCGKRTVRIPFPIWIIKCDVLTFVYIDINDIKLLEMQKPHCYVSLIQIDASKTIVPAALNLIVEKTSLI